MPKCLAVPLALCFVSPLTCSLADAQQATPSPATQTEEDVLKAYRASMQSSRADLMAKNITLTAEQAAKFWPVFEQYQKEQNLIMDEHLKAMQKYMEASQNLDDASAL